MTYHISIAGKGSAGKSTLLPLVIASARQSRPRARILVVDADPQHGATDVLNMCPKTTLGDLLNTHAAMLRSGKGLEEARDTWLRAKIQEQAILRIAGFDFLAMGRSTARGCQCIVNNLLGRALGVVMQDYDILITDNEAGLEHMGRFADLPVDHLLLIALLDDLFLNVAQMIHQQGRDAEREIRHTTLLLNQTNESEAAAFWQRLAELDSLGIAYGGAVPPLSALHHRPISPSLVMQAYWWGDVGQLFRSVLALEEEGFEPLARRYSA